MIMECCARGIVLLLLVSSSFSRNVDDTSKTLDASVNNPALTSAQHRQEGAIGGRLRRWNPSHENAGENHRAASIDEEQRIDDEVPEEVNTTSEVKDSRYGYFVGPSHPYGPYRPQYFFQVATTTRAPGTNPNTGICQQLAANAGITAPTALQIFLQQCASLLGLITSPTTTAAPTIRPPVTGICQLLAANAGITSPIALQAYLLQCALLLSLINAPTSTAPTITPPVTGICQLLAANAGITSPTALQAYLQQCALLLSLINAPTTTAPMTTAAPTITPPFTGVCQLLAGNAGITSPTALQAFLQQCAVLLGLVNG